MKKKAKKRIQWQQYIAVAIFMLIGGVCGVLMAQYVGKNVQPDTFIGVELFSLACLFLGMYIAIFIQLIIHEAGHLVFGLISGYKFSSFRIFSFMWVKENEKVRLRRKPGGTADCRSWCVYLQ